MAADIRSRSLDLYRRYIGEPDEPRDVYAGFGLFFAGAAAAVVGLGLFLASTVPPEQAPVKWQLREAAFAASAVGLPTFLASLVVLLPSRRPATVAAALGTAVSFAGVGVFIVNYPYNWNVPGPDASAGGILIYSLGVAALATASGTALVTNYIERASSVAEASAAGGNDSASGGDPESTIDDRVERDIEEAMGAADLTWGGVERTETKRITFSEDDSLADADTSSFDTVDAVESRSTGTDEQVSELQKLRGSEPEEVTSSGTDEQADALSAMRERQRQEAQRRAAEAGPIERLRDRLGL